MRKLISLSLGLAAFLAGAAPASAQQKEPYRVIVNAANPATSISREELARVYMKKTTSWKTGEAVAVVDQSPRSDVRAVFSTSVLGRDVATMKNYWQQSLFSGRGVPPIEQPGDAQVAAFVATNANAIGYVSPTAALPEGVRVLEITR
jgi:ABC-type phosphate transport system substrate-binding protein